MDSSEARSDPREWIEGDSGVTRDPPPWIDPGRLVFETRAVLGLSQRELARRSGIRQPQICALESGKEALFSSYARLFQAMGVRLELKTHPIRPREEFSAELLAERIERERLLRERRLSARSGGSGPSPSRW